MQLKNVQLNGGKTFQLVQDDLLHPYCGGNKLRKLDGILPELLGQGVTDMVRTSCNLTSCTQHHAG